MSVIVAAIRVIIHLFSGKTSEDAAGHGGFYIFQDRFNFSQAVGHKAFVQALARGKQGFPVLGHVLLFTIDWAGLQARKFR